MGAFTHREEYCPECGGSGVRMGVNYNDVECFDCGGQGSWEATCADCSEAKPVNSDGVCIECAAENALLDLTVQSLGGGTYRVAA